ncbi:PadR family transcriptional regulator [Acinetobacter sp. LoGeW2-3]|uniref:PadR family transcriptional regulator n=1 Tax=Acinetobacter sp. LoGeW2-3 TaxID=1808001 RepID=UPI000C05B867|nr:PadR family transcriptional regulator [Acinetobacter sp. LoGeW2-3]ATO18297.1 PadR family transcriptional regulator [Acinetobacter sp. LoGeW2-3]
MSKTPHSVISEERENSPKPRKRLFEAGQMKLLVLHFVAQKPKYSYDIIKDVAALVGGNYKPSTGTICPTINYLEEQQFISAEITADERKRYSISSQGIKHLAAQKEAIELILSRFETRRRIQTDERYSNINQAMENLKASLRLKLQTDINAEQIKDIADQIEQAAAKIVDL